MISPDKVRIGMLKIKHLDYNQSNRVHWLDEVRFAGFAHVFALLQGVSECYRKWNIPSIGFAKYQLFNL